MLSSTIILFSQQIPRSHSELFLLQSIDLNPFPFICYFCVVVFCFPLQLFESGHIDLLHLLHTVTCTNFSSISLTEMVILISVRITLKFIHSDFAPVTGACLNAISMYIDLIENLFASR